MKDQNDITVLSQSLANLEEDAVNQLIEGYLTTNGDPLMIVDALSKGMEKVGRLYKDGEYALAELIYSGEIFKGAMERVKPFIKAGNDMSAGRIIMGTVMGDIHDLGKSIVTTMLECSGFSVIDLGVDVPAERFVEAVKNSGAKLVGMSLLLTTAMDAMRETIQSLEKAGLRDCVKIMIGGAPTSERLRDEIGADFYGRDAIEAVSIARHVLADQTEEEKIPS
jgi:methylmalonyl-CoA mutase cobalamin-binding domain/chain